jgi:thymidine phosphorylase
VVAGEAVCTVYYNSEARATQAQRVIESSYCIGAEQSVAGRPLIHKIIEPEGWN